MHSLLQYSQLTNCLPVWIAFDRPKIPQEKMYSKSLEHITIGLGTSCVALFNFAVTKLHLFQLVGALWIRSKWLVITHYICEYTFCFYANFRVCPQQNSIVSIFRNWQCGMLLSNNVADGIQIKWRNLFAIFQQIMMNAAIVVYWYVSSCR